MNPIESLTEREKEILQLLAEGKTNAEIAAELKNLQNESAEVSVHTVKAHLDKISVKLDTKGRLNILVKALQHCIVPCPSKTCTCKKNGLRRTIKLQQ